MQKTLRYFDTDAYKTGFEANVLSCTADKEGYAVILDGTLFFPEEGGQKSDIGILGDANVIGASIRDGIITHYTDKPLMPGATVAGKIDFARRFRQMQNHSGEHIASGLFHSLYGLENVGFHLGLQEMTIDLSGELGRAELLRVERLANEAVYRNLPITADYVPPEKLAHMVYRSKLDLKENVRIVTIPGIDVCACCAPHVRCTGEIGIIKFLDFIRYKGGIRVYMHCGSDALLDYEERYAATAHIAGCLSLKQAELAPGFDRFYGEYQSRGEEIYRLKCRLAAAKAQAVSHGEGVLCLFEEENDPVFLRELAKAALEKHGGPVCLCAKAEEGYSYLFVSQTENLKEKATAMHSILGGRGGGKEHALQGRFTATEEDIRRYFARF